MSDGATYRFDAEAFLPRAIYELIGRLRVADPIAAYKATQTRQPRKALAPDGGLLLLMADEAARGIAPACEDRHEYLARVLRVLIGGVFDGVVAPPDLFEELCLAQQIIRENGGQSFLDGRVAIGVLNADAGRLTPSAFNVARAKHLRCDGVWLRASIETEGDRAGEALAQVAQLIEEVNEHQAVIFLQPGRPEHFEGAPWEAAEAAGLLSTVSALGQTSIRTWLAVPAFDGVDRALRAVTLPTLATGFAPPGDDLSSLLHTARDTLASTPRLRGIALGSSILYRDDDPLAVAGALQAVLRGGAEIDTVLERMDQARGRRFDVISSLVEGKELKFEGGMSAASYV